MPRLICYACYACAESVIVSPEGVATMLDKFGAVHEAIEGPDGSFELNPKPRAWLGPGRPLGAAFDADGNLYVCDALKVCQADIGGPKCLMAAAHHWWPIKCKYLADNIMMPCHVSLNIGSINKMSFSVSSVRATSRKECLGFYRMA